MANMEAKTRAEEIIKEYLENETSEVFREKLANSTKTLTGCMNYIMSEAKKQAVSNQACIPDAEVFGWAVHYFEEDTIRETTTAPAGTVNASKPKKDKTTVTIPATEPGPVKKPEPKKKVSDDQMSIFELMGG